LTRPEEAAAFLERTGVDFLVVNLGTEHRAAAADRKYRADRARQIAEAVGPRLVLHGASSLPPDAIRDLFADGVRKVNIWTALERDSSPVLLREMVTHAAKVAGRDEARRLCDEGLLGPSADTHSPASISHFTTRYRQQIIFERMKRIAIRYLRLLY
jgi:fructose/tagatose bisphosphate aldolase